MLSARPTQFNADGPHFPSRTPGRGLKNRTENAHAGGAPMTVHGKGKNAMAPKTPFQPSSVQPQRLFKDQKTVLTTVTRPLGDKTPLPNRHGTTLFQTPSLQKSKLSQLIPVDPIQQRDALPPGSMQRPSSTRTHLKHPRTSGPKNFETPMNNGNHWDVSDGDIVVPDSQALLQETIVEDDADDDEIEYCAPNNLDLPYEPPFDFELPDYKVVGQALRQLVFSNPCDDSPVPAEIVIPASELQLSSWNMIPLPPLESDDPFYLARLESGTLTKPVATSSKPLSRVTNGAATKPSTKPSIVSRTRPQSSFARLGNETKAPASRPTSRHTPSVYTGSTAPAKIVQKPSNAARPMQKPSAVVPKAANPARGLSSAASVRPVSSRPATAQARLGSVASASARPLASKIRAVPPSKSSNPAHAKTKSTAEESSAIFTHPVNDLELLGLEGEFIFEV